MEDFDGGTEMRQDRRGERARRWEIDGIAFGRTAFHPLHDAFDFRRGQAWIVTELARAVNRSPRRHAARKNLVADGLGPGAGFGVGRERNVSGRTVAAQAAVLDDTGDFLCPGDFGGDWIVGEDWNAEERG